MTHSPARKSSMARAIWKGAISFGLVHIPVALVSATSSQGVDFDWLDKRSMDPVGYKRVNKVRSEAHTSELQSLMRFSYAVFCLKKKNTLQQPHTYTIT